MSLDAYLHTRLIVQSAQTSVVDAARAMKTNEVGCVVVTEHRRVVGIVTDRDLALRVVAEGRDPASTALAEVMSVEVVTLHPSAKSAEALRLMRERGVRRIPLVERHRVVGMLTLDDLLLDQVGSIPDMASVVRSQIIEAGPARTRRFDEWRWLERRYARADATRTRLVIETQRTTGLRSRDRAEAALGIVLLAIVQRLPPKRAARVIAQLPALFQERLTELAPEHDAGITRETIEAEIAERLRVSSCRAAVIVDGVGRALTQDGRLTHNLRRYLPEGMRTIFTAEAPPITSKATARRVARTDAVGIATPRH